MKSYYPVLLLLGIVFIAGCTTGTQQNTSGAGQQNTPPTVATKEPSEMVLQLSDMPVGNWSIAERTERTRNDVSPEALALGWQKGYYVRLYKTEGTIFENTVVENSLSVYPIENISQVVSIPSNRTGTITNRGIVYSFIIEDLSNPNIGDDSKAYRWTLNDSSGDTLRHYEIEFVKFNVYQNLYMSGVVTDYELLKDLANKAVQKIG